MTAPTGTEATTARIAEVLAEHQLRIEPCVKSNHFGAFVTITCTCGTECDAPEGTVDDWHRAHLAALLSAGVIRDMQAAAWDRCFRYYGLGATDAENPYRAARLEEAPDA